MDWCNFLPCICGSHGAAGFEALHFRVDLVEECHSAVDTDIGVFCDHSLLWTDWLNLLGFDSLGRVIRPPRKEIRMK